VTDDLYIPAAPAGGSLHEEKEFNLAEDLPPPSDSRRFAPEEMVACESCSRANPPTRMRCLYCGVKLPETQGAATMMRPALRPLEVWEQGFNVVLTQAVTGGALASSEARAEVSMLLRMEAGLLEEFWDTARRSPSRAPPRVTRPS
jgi:hypothetical protein